MARQPLPRQLKIDNGETRPSRVNYDDPDFSGQVPCPPHWLDDEAKTEWKRIAPYLSQYDLLTEADRAEFCNYCVAWSDFVEAVKTLQEQGKYYETQQGYVYPNPAVGERNKAAERMHRYAQQFGLTPSHRQKISTSKHDENTDSKDWFEY